MKGLGFFQKKKKGIRIVCPLLFLLFNILLYVIAISISQEEELKNIEIVKKEEKPSLSTEHIIIYVENPKKPTSKVLKTNR